jgi:alkanesulfonate monooxygenase SsuD/methylene tetrahydromethanopterin reductase-like flavin-dependent oxidoreductase (luciferase family)
MYWESVDKLGVDRNPYRAGFVQFVGVADSDAEAERLYSEAGLYFHNRCFYISPRFLQAPGYLSIETMLKGMKSQMKAAAEMQAPDLTWKQIIDRGYIIAGSPETVADQLTELADTLNVGHLMVMLHYGNMPKETVLHNTELFATKVMPRLRDKFSDWEDRWWPTDTLPELATPAPVGAEA